MRRLDRKVAAALILALVLVFGSVGTGPVALAQVAAAGPVSFFYGYVIPDAAGHLPIRVRALGDQGIVCGSAEVLPAGGLGFYVIGVRGATDKAGCPSAGDPVRFLLLAGAIDDGTLADALPAWQPGGIENVTLAPAPASSVGLGWVGLPPPSGGTGMLTWAGPTGTPVVVALQALPFPVSAVWRFNTTTRTFDLVGPGALAASTGGTLTTGDVVLVRASL